MSSQEITGQQSVNAWTATVWIPRSTVQPDGKRKPVRTEPDGGCSSCNNVM